MELKPKPTVRKPKLPVQPIPTPTPLFTTVKLRPTRHRLYSTESVTEQNIPKQTNIAQSPIPLKSNSPKATSNRSVEVDRTVQADEDTGTTTRESPRLSPPLFKFETQASSTSTDVKVETQDPATKSLTAISGEHEADAGDSPRFPAATPAAARICLTDIPNKPISSASKHIPLTNNNISNIKVTNQHSISPTNEESDISGTSNHELSKKPATNQKVVLRTANDVSQVSNEKSAETSTTNKPVAKSLSDIPGPSRKPRTLVSPPPSTENDLQVR